MSDLSEFSGIIARMGEESRRRDDEELAAAKAQLPAKKIEARTLEGATLLEWFENYVGHSFADPRMTAVTQELADACRAELRARLGGTRPLNPVTANR